MYNLHKYREEQRILDSQKDQDEKYTRWLIKNQNIKVQAKEKQKNKLLNFIQQQQKNPIIFQDDHYNQWRLNRQFRDVENQNHFLGFKSFRHKPSKEMNKYFDQRERKQIEFNAKKAQNLVDSKIIHEQQRARSLRSQGPLNPKHSFRQKKSDQEYPQPRMRYTNFTDKQRQLQSSISYDDKFKSVYESFEMKRSSIGKAKAKPLQFSRQLDMVQSAVSDRLYQTAKPSKFLDKLNNEQESHYLQGINKKQLRTDHCSNRLKSLSKTTGFGKTFDRLKNLEDSKMSSEPKFRKTYFKLVKTSALQGCSQSKKLLLKSQYDRSKDMKNIVNNTSCENYTKRPIL